MKEGLRKPLLQSGQAVIEATIACLALGALWWAIIWLARLQDFSLHVHHGVRYAAFSLSREGQFSADRIDASWQALPKQWVSSNQTPLLEIYDQRQWRLQHLAPVATQAQAGASDTMALAMARELGTADEGSWRVAHHLMPAVQTALAPFPIISRKLAIAVGAGHGESDANSRERLEQSATTWSRLADVSSRLLDRVDNGASGVDAAWKRASPSSRWLQLWEAEVP